MTDIFNPVIHISKMTERQLIKYRDDLHDLHTGIIYKNIAVSSHPTANLETNVVFIKDKRLEDLIFRLFCEAHNELIERFSNQTKIDTEML